MQGYRCLGEKRGGGQQKREWDQANHVTITQSQGPTENTNPFRRRRQRVQATVGGKRGQMIAVQKGGVWVAIVIKLGDQRTHIHGNPTTAVA